MTKQYQVTGVKVSFGPGIALGLTDEQAQPRLSCLKKIPKGLYAGLYQVTAPVEFKQGEVIGLDVEVPKSLIHKLAPLDTAEDDPQGFKIRHKGSGRYDVVDGKGVLVTDRLLSKDEAEALVEKLTAEAQP